MSTIGRPNLDRELARLKNFQRDTVEYVFSRMYSDKDPTRRFLVADEVGLGKTMVARGLVAQVVNHLWDDVERIDIIYICSNGSIARQNINRLNISEAKDAALPTRITLLPTVVKGLQQRKLNFISLTPQTTFDLRSKGGRHEERVLLYHMLPDSWRAGVTGTAIQNLLQGGASRDAFRARVKEFDIRTIDEGLRGAFEAQIAADEELERDFRRACDAFQVWREMLPEDDWVLQREVIGRLRVDLAVSCLNALQPDLVILDEFQRFKHLLDGTDKAGELAQKLFNFGDARVLLLSATPYKMYTIAEESESDDHFRDFLQTVTFLQGDAARTSEFKGALDEYRNGLFALGTHGASKLDEARSAVEGSLRQVMVRTERLAVSADRNGMLAEVAPRLPLTADDVATYVAYARAAETLQHSDITEYWKSAPFLFNFMDDYQLKEAFRSSAASPKLGPVVRDVLAGCPRTLLNWDDVERYKRLDPANARLRHLISDVIDGGAWRFLWVPAAMPYYEPGGAFASPDAARVTKRLMFSSWQVVPKVVAAVLSYEAERAMFGDRPDVERPNTAEERERFTELLRFSRSGDRLTGMAVVSLLYPSISLAMLGDPLQVARTQEDRSLPKEQLIAIVADRLRPILAELASGESAGAEDQGWYWAAPALLDLRLNEPAARGWFEQPGLAAAWRDVAGEAPDDEPARADAWADHVAMFLRAAFQQHRLGRQPQDLPEVLARLALAGPAVCALRALTRMCGDPDVLERVPIRNKAGWIAFGFRSLFNLPEVTAMVRRETADERYWQSVLEYCLDGNLQAVVDEYLHVAQEAEGVAHRPFRDAARAVAKRASDALTLRTSTLGVDVVSLENSGFRLEDKRMRARFAARFGAQQTDDGAGAVRADDVRAAFNSPFWPFVLCSTSVGQEGLDFHLYCHAVVHWNLPSNPVDMEQREGRVHRYKGHAIRKNTAMLYGEGALLTESVDPWSAAFAAAAYDREAGTSDLTPYWVLSPEGGARIERHVPALPLSRDVERAEALRRTLTVYRMAFGQNRQDDLIAYLTSRFPQDEIERLSARLKIDLSPPPAQYQPTDAAIGRDVAPDDHDHRPSEALRRGSRLRLRDATTLLDAFADLRQVAETASIQHYRDLLDQYAVLSK